MLKRLLVLVVLISAQSGWATSDEEAEACITALLKGELDSTTYSISLDESLNPQAHMVEGDLDGTAASLIAAEIAHQANCELEIMNFSLPNCQAPFSGRPEAQICMIESEFGYFLISKDYLNTYHAIFVRWD